MAIVRNSDNLGNKLLHILGLPEYTIWFEIGFKVGEIVTVTCAYYPDLGKPEKGKEFLEIIKRYELREIPEIPLTEEQEL